MTQPLREYLDWNNGRACPATPLQPITARGPCKRRAICGLLRAELENPVKSDNLALIFPAHLLSAFFSAMEYELETVVQRLPRRASDEEAGHVGAKQPQASTSGVTVEEHEAIEDARALPRRTSSEDHVEGPASPQPPTPTRLKAHIMYGTLLWTMFLSGWNDATTGPLIPRIQEVYHVGPLPGAAEDSHWQKLKFLPGQIGFLIVSLIFVVNFLVRLSLYAYISYIALIRCAQGFATAAGINVWLTDKYGFGKVWRSFSIKEEHADRPPKGHCIR